MLKGGAIMDVTNAEQAKIAEDAGAVSVMALERVPSDIRKDGGVARMSAIDVIDEIMRTVSIPVMAKVRIGHFVELSSSRRWAWISSTRARCSRRPMKSITSTSSRSTFPSCADAATSARHFRRIGEGAALIRTKGEAGSGNIVEAVRHLRSVNGHMRRLTVMATEELMAEAKQLGAPFELVRDGGAGREAPGSQLRRRRRVDAGRRRALHAARCGDGLRRFGNLQVRGPPRPGQRRS